MKRDINTWMRKIALGTVQFGLDYGISNKTGKISVTEAESILDFASHSGVNTLDTAAAYGSSETTLGRIITDKPYRFELISKLPTGVTPNRFREALQQSLTRLQVPHLHGYLAHNFSGFQNQEVRQAFRQAKECGLIHKIGVSVYYPQEVRWLLDENVIPDIIQLPFNVFDQRFRELFSEIKANHTEIHARSIFLQGLFFMPVKKLSSHFDPVKEKLKAMQQLGERIPLSALLLNHAIMQNDIDKVVIGVTGLQELQENLRAVEYFDTENEVYQTLDEFTVTDEQIILPMHWS